MKKQIWIVLIVMGLASLACSINIPVSLTNGDVGEMQTLQVDEQVDTASSAILEIEMGGGELNITGGADNLVEGSIRYNVEEWQPNINRDGERLSIRQDLNTLPVEPRRDITNEWDLQLGDQPLELAIRAGAYSGRLDLGGLSILRLEISDGASEAEVVFNSPNLVRMETFDYRTGASNVTISGIANANTAVFTFTGGAGQATLDFSGELQDNMTVEIEGGVGDYHIIVPAGTHCILRNTGSLIDIDQGGWEKDGDTYTVPGDGPVIEILANVSVGSLELDVE